MPESPCVDSTEPDSHHKRRMWRAQIERWQHSGKVALAFLDDYHGYMQSEDYEGYDYLGKKKTIINMACLALPSTMPCATGGASGGGVHQIRTMD